MTELPDWAQRLDLAPHPEGGWFRETWRSDADDRRSPRCRRTTTVRAAPGPPSCSCSCPASSRRGTPCAAPSCGSTTAAVRCCCEFGAEQESAATHLLGRDITAGEHPQLLVPPGHWQRARPRDDEPALVSCVVVPGFDFADFALAAPTD